MLHQIKAPQLYTDSGLQRTVLNPLANGKFKDFSMPLSVFQVLFKVFFFIFKDFSRQSCIFKYFSSLCEPCLYLRLVSLTSSIRCFNSSSERNDGLCDASVYAVAEPEIRNRY